MGRTDKSARSNKLLFLNLAVTVVFCTCVAVAVFYLDLKRKEEVAQLRNYVISYGEEIVYLRQQLDQHENAINETASTVHKIKGDAHKATQSKTVTPEEEDYYYEEAYDYEDDDDDDEDVDDIDDTTASAPIIGENVAPSQDRSVVITNGTLSVRHRRHISQEDDDANVLSFQRGAGQGWFSNSHKQTTEDIRRSLVQHNLTELPASDQLAELLPLYQEQSLSKETSVRLRHNRSRKKEKRESRLETVTRYEPDVVAAHFAGDTLKKYKEGVHKHYAGNKRMYHPNGVFKDWVVADWTRNLNMSSFFRLDDGVLTVRKAGLYLIYAQIYYATSHDTSGFHLYQNSDIVAQCTTTMIHCPNNKTNSDSIVKRNSCFTSIILHLQPSDKLKLKEVEGHRYTVFDRMKSFFGLIRLMSL